MDPMYQNIGEILTFIGIVFGTLTAAYIFYKRVLKRPVCGFCNSVRSFFTIGGKIERVYSELTSNGGTSVKDSVKRIEDNVVVLMNKHRIIVDDYHTGILETDAKGNITWANATFLEMTSRDLREILGNGWINTVCAEDRERVYRTWHDAFTQQRPFEGAFRMVRPDGKILEVKGFAYPIKGKERIQGYIGKIKILMEKEDV